MRSPKAPFAKKSCAISGFLHQVRKEDLIPGHGALSFKRRIMGHSSVVPNRTAFIPFIISPDKSVPAVFSCENHITGGCTHRSSRIVMCKAHPVPGKRIQVGGFDQLLAKAPQISVAQVVGQYENNIGLQILLILRLHFALAATCANHQST